MGIEQHENSIREYLLGELAEPDQMRLEQELLTDESKFNQVWAIENELIDSYARAEMSGADRGRFERHYLASLLHRERVAIAGLLLSTLDRTSGESINLRSTAPVASWWRSLPARLHWPRLDLGGAWVMTLLVAFVALWALIEKNRLSEQITKFRDGAQSERTSLIMRREELASRNRELEKEINDGRQLNEQLKAELERSRRGQQTRSAAVFSFLLTPTLLRGENSLPPPTIPLLHGQIRLLMELESDDYRSYQGKLQTAEGREMLLLNAAKVNSVNDRAFAMLRIPAGVLIKGDYVLILFGRTADGRREEIERYFFHVS